MFLNADILTNKKNELDFIVEQVRPLILGVSEVLPKKFKRSIYPEEFNISDYEMLSHPNITENQGRGSILYIHKTISYKEITLKSQIHFEEAILAEINISKKDKILCAHMYRRGESTEENNKGLLMLLKEIASLKYSHLLIFGDFNLPSINWENYSCPGTDSNNINFKFIECIRDCYLFQHITEPTRQRGNDSPSTLDLLFTNEQHMVSHIEYHAPLGRSDHSVISFNLTCYSEPKTPNIKVQYNKGNYEEFNQYMNNINWKEELSKFPDDVDAQLNFFEEKYHGAEQLFVPRKNVYVNGRYSKKLSTPLDRKTLLKLKKKNKIWGRIPRGIAEEEMKTH